jgi:hypothetical protein
MVLALAILGASLSILSQIAGTGVDAAREARGLVTSRLLCQTKLNEILMNLDAGQAPTTIVDAPVEAAFDSTSMLTYTYSVEVMPGQLDGLLATRVTVKAYGGDGSTPLTTYAVDRWVIDPAIGLVEAEMEEQAAREQIAGGGEEAMLP